MLKDISDWEHIGYGGKSTLEKEELKSPTGLKYIIKYPRKFELGVSWEDITELIAAKIGSILGLEMMEVEIVTRGDERGCLLRNFVDEYGAKMHEEGGVLLDSLADGYDELQASNSKNKDLIAEGFHMLTQFNYWSKIKDTYIDMLIFDILIGNQDRHPFNWQILYFDTGYRFSPIYDNGASLGFRLEDHQLHEMVSNRVKVDRYVRNARVKAGMFERKHVKAKDLLEYIQVHFPNELKNSIRKLDGFDLVQYQEFIQTLNLLSEAQKDWLELIIPYRRQKIFEWIKGGG
ncbi:MULTISPECIES: HipA domain-containing protein [unclassified Sporosarcina]|uniref:HipA domain-containing protein n=1 Tax=unclassified Sporosarcina TaxID=2647733 RepID=UPI0020426A3F|nr:MULTISPECIES: HipA domain-containing protein [unclassified Sporosarcina]